MGAVTSGCVTSEAKPDPATFETDGDPGACDPVDADTKVFYVSQGNEDASPSSKGTTRKAKGFSLLKTKGASSTAIFPDKLDRDKVQEFRDFLTQSGVDHSTWGMSAKKSVEHLFWEVFVQRGSLITRNGAEEPLKRVTRIVKISIVADIFGVDHVLKSRLQFLHDGRSIERTQVLVRRLVWNKDLMSEPNKAVVYDPIFEDEQCQGCEFWRDGVKNALRDRLGLSVAFQEQHLEEQLHSVCFRIEDKCQSEGFPGLITQYCIHDVTIRVSNTGGKAVQCMGLPTGQEFATSEGDFNLSKELVSGSSPLGTQLNIWSWERCAPRSRSMSVSSAKAMAKAVAAPEKPRGAEPDLTKKVPLPEDSIKNIQRIRAGLNNASVLVPPSPVLDIAQYGRKTDWTRAKRIAHRIADPTYSLRAFTEDLQAFAELDFYLLDDPASFSSIGSRTGRTLDDEYQRTVGAFYAIYWLMRLKSDGKDGFCFGVDEDWKPILYAELSSDKAVKRIFPAEKRQKFYQESAWNDFEQLLVDADMLVRKGSDLEVNEIRVLTMLALTAAHDIMKVEALLPTVQAEHAPYHGYACKDTIADHDHALSYMMDHYPHLVPSFNGLDPQERFSVTFTQCQLQFNQGWFVQAEAPPGAIFTKFKELLTREKQSKVTPRDIGLYFVHWLTDLAGAEPTPLAGCEKFVVKFPLPVLNSFLRSFCFVRELAHKTETEVMEEYLKMRWQEHVPDLGPVPTGDAAIAKMRLICMAQMNSVPVLSGFDDLSNEDKEILSIEMARTGCIGQSFSTSLTPVEVQKNQLGPALLIYYGPAFLQTLGRDNPTKRLVVLAEVYRAARELWPPSVAQVSTSVIIRVDTIKALSVKEIHDIRDDNQVWVLVKHNELEAFVERSSTSKLNVFISSNQDIQVLAMDP